MSPRSKGTWRRTFGGVLVALTASHAMAATVREGFSPTIIASGLSRPTAMAVAPDGRIFVAEQDGALRVIKDGVLLPEPFLRLTVNAAGERGLLGIAFDPGFASNGFVYVYYTATTPAIHNRVSRFTAAGDVAVAGSEVPLLDLPPLTATNHNGGAVHVGPDGFLYIGVGDNAVGANAQSLNTPFGKLLRIALDGSIPSSNPFLGQTSGINRAIWALGLRNPFTFAFDPASGRLLINDVGENAWEEINEGIPGANYGWPHSEGQTSNPAHTGPLFAYSHAATGGCAIVGGAFYPVVPMQFPAEYAGHYFFADLCAGWIRRFDVTSGVVAGNFASGIAAPVGLAIGPEGALYYLARGTGASTGIVGRIDFTGTSTPPVRRPPAGGGSNGRMAVPRETAPARQAVARPAGEGRERFQEPRPTMSVAHSHMDEPPGPGSGDRTGAGAHVDSRQPDMIGSRMSPAFHLPPPGPGPAAAVAEGPLMFRTARMTPSMSPDQVTRLTADGEGWMRITGATLRQLIHLASGLPVPGETSDSGAGDLLAGPMRDDVHLPPLQFVNPPAWIDSQRFDLEAYAGTGHGHEDVRKMLHTLLRERFRLVARFVRFRTFDVAHIGAEVAGMRPPVPADVLVIDRVEQPRAAGRRPGADQGR